MAYAEGTNVAIEKSQADIAGLLMKYGATGFNYGWDDGKAVVMFRVVQSKEEGSTRVVRFNVPLPDRDDRQFRISPAGRVRSNPEAAYEAELRRRWRVLFLVIKAKLEAVVTEVTTFEEEFLAHIVMPGTGLTIYEEAQERLHQAYLTGDPVDILPGLPRVSTTPQLEGVVDAEIV